MALCEKYRQILARLPFEPRNESETRFWVIEEVLRQVLGYPSHEIAPEQLRTDAGTCYVILPGSEISWLLYGVSWKTELTEEQARRVVALAQERSILWTALTNGQEWRLYDASPQWEDPADRLILSGSRTDEAGMEALLRALHRVTATEEGIAGAVMRDLLVKHLRAELQNPESESVTALCWVASKRPGLYQVTGTDIVAVLPRAIHPPTVQASRRTTRVSAPRRPVAHVSPFDEDISLATASSQQVTGRKPEAVVLPDGTSIPVNTWKEVFLEVVRFALEQGPVRLRLPWTTGGWRKFWIAGEPPSPDDDSVLSPKELEVGGRVFYVETHASAACLISIAQDVCRDAGVDADEIRVVVHSGGRRVRAPRAPRSLF